MLVFLMAFLLDGSTPPQPIAGFTDERKCVAAADTLRKEHYKVLAEGNGDVGCFTLIQGERV